MTNRVVRKGIYEGDQIDEVVGRFAHMFGLKSKQEKMLKKRLH